MEEELKKLDEKIEEAKKGSVDIDIRDAILVKAKWYHQHKDYENAKKNYLSAYEFASGATKKMDILFEILLIALESQSLDLIRDNIEKCKKLMEEGGDWEHRNRLNVYEGIYNILIRNFKVAATLLLESVPTFTCTEIFSFKELVFYAVLTSMVALNRTAIRQKVIHSPEILSEIRNIPSLKKFSDSLFNCEYKLFFESFRKYLFTFLFIFL